MATRADADPAPPHSAAGAGRGGTGTASRPRSRRATPVDEALARIDRRARERWVVAFLVVGGATTITGLLLSGGVADRQRVWLGGALAAAVVLYLVSVLLEERRTRRALRALLDARARGAQLATRVRTLEALHEAAGEVAAAIELPDVFDRLLDAALGLSEARAGAVLLRVGQTLTVAASTGPGVPAPGTVVPRGSDPAWAAVDRAGPVHSVRGNRAGDDEEPDSIAVPLRLPERIVGALVVERADDAPPFTEADQIAVALFAQHAALVVRNATHHDRDADRIERLEQERGARASEAAAIVHDLRAPLASVLGYAQLLRERGDRLGADRRQHIVADVVAELDRLRAMLDDLLPALQLEAGLTRLADLVDVDLGAVVHDAVRTARGLAHRAGGDRTVVVGMLPPVTVVGDAEALVRVVVNLLDNAVRHAPAGTAVEVEVAATEGRGIVRVRDRGPGVSAGADDRPRSAGRGGLGLQVVRSLVAAHGGEVVVDDGDDGGTVAELRLPRRHEDVPVAQRPPSQ